MQEITLLHNPKCSKSREALEIISQESGINLTISKYIESPLSENEITKLLSILIDDKQTLIRKTDKSFEETMNNIKDNNNTLSFDDINNLSESEIIQLLITEPKLMQRPIVIANDKAIIARPTDKILPFIR